MHTQLGSLPLVQQSQKLNLHHHLEGSISYQVQNIKGLRRVFPLQLVSASSQPGSGDSTSNTTMSIKGREKDQNWNNESVFFFFFLIQIKRNLKSLLRMLIMKDGKLSKGQRRETTGVQDRVR